MRNKLKADSTFVIIVMALVIGGFIIFMSALLGLKVREDISFVGIAINRIAGLIIGVLGALVVSNINYKHLKKYAFYIFVASFLTTMLVFIPGLGVEHGGAKRWIDIGPISFQPVEFLKVGFIIYFAALLSSMRKKINFFKDGILPIMILLGFVAVLLLSQPDTSSFITIFIAAVAMFIAAGGYLRYAFASAGIGLLGIVVLALTRPYIMSRIMIFFDPSASPQDAGYQIQQSLIAIGSGGLFGRGFGQSIQKFNYLPEPIGDSIFAVAAEEFGFVGAVVIIALITAFAVRGLHIAKNASSVFGGLLVVGIVILVVFQSFINIAAMLGVVPLTGMPLIFISHGSSSIVFALIMMGIVFNVSKYNKKI